MCFYLRQPLYLSKEQKCFICSFISSHTVLKRYVLKRLRRQQKWWKNAFPEISFIKTKRKLKKKCQNEVFQGHKKMLATIWGEFILKK